MPTADDTPTLQALLGDSLLAAEVTATTKLSRSDLIQVYDVSEKTVKSITVRELGEAFGLTFT